MKEMNMNIVHDNNPVSVFDKHYSLKCPHCGSFSNITAISIPRYEFLARFHPTKVGIVYRCDACNFPVFLRFHIEKYDLANHKIQIDSKYEVVEIAHESFEFAYLPNTVADEFREALICYSNACYNAFAAMCRRCIQSAFEELGAKGKDKVLEQLKEIKDTANLDAETFDMLQQIIISGHDGAHPHLPKLSPERATILLELMKDVLYQLFVRKAKIQEAIDLRKKDISQEKAG
jgi:hypothetical protein